MKVFCLSSPLLHYLNIVLHVPWLLCSFSLFWLILGFDGALSYQGVFITHPVCSYQCPSWSQSFAVTCTALGQPKLTLPHSLQLRGFGPSCPGSGGMCSVGGRGASSRRALDSNVKCVPTTHQIVAEASPYFSR